MEIELNYVSWMIIGAACLAPIGAVFGAAAAVLARRQGHAPGSSWAFRAADWVVRFRGRELSVVGRGAVVGAVDGFLFLAVIGSVVGLVAGYGSSAPEPMLLAGAAVGLALLAGTAALLGGLANVLVGAQMGGVILFCASGVGALLGFCLTGFSGAGYGLLAGSVVGLIGVAANKRKRSNDTPEESG